MGKNTKRVKQFIEDIPDEKLSGFGTSGRTIHHDNDFRLDMQGMTSDDPARHNLQVQINKQTTITSLKKAAPKTVATLIVPAERKLTAEQIKQGLTVPADEIWSAERVRQGLIDSIEI